MYDLQFYAKTVNIEAEGAEVLNVLARGVDLANFLQDLTNKDILDCLELGDIVDYIAERTEEDNE